MLVVVSDGRWRGAVIAAGAKRSFRRLVGRGSSLLVSQVSLVFADRWLLLLISI